MKVQISKDSEGTVVVDYEGGMITTEPNGDFNVSDMVQVLVACGIDVDYRELK